MNKKTFTNRYNDILQNKKRVITISAESIMYIQESLDEYEKMDTWKFVIVTFVAIFFFATAPACFSFFYDLMKEAMPFIQTTLSQKEYIDNNAYVTISSLFVFICVPIYTILMPSRVFQFDKMLSSMTLVTKGFTYHVYSITLNDLALL